MALMLEATVALHKRDDAGGAARSAEAGLGRGGGLHPGPRTEGQWSEEDKAFLKTFKISLE